MFKSLRLFALLAAILAAVGLAAGTASAQVQPDSMLYEIAQVSPDIGAIPPTADAGFGSTNNGALGTMNVQKYIRIAGEPGQSIVGTWLSAGANVAPLLAGAPFNVDSLVATFRDDNTYTVRQVDKNGTVVILEGTYAAEASGVDEIQNITVNQTSPVPLTAKGIFRIFNPPPPDTMRYEIAQTDPDIGAIPPTADAGFGSTNAGALGMMNVQTYIRIGGDPGMSIVGTWLSAGAMVAPLLAGAPFNVDTLVATFRDDNTYTVRQVDKNGVVVILEGTYSAAPSGVGNIYNITVNQSSPVTLTAKGIFEITSVVTSVAENPGLPERFRLYQNYPNPFNPATRIRFELPQPAKVKLTVFDRLGREVATLIDARLAAGLHEIPFQARRLASGVYLYRLEVDGRAVAKQMLLVK